MHPASLSSPGLLVTDVSVCTAFLPEVAVRRIICGFTLFIYFSSGLCCPLRFQGSPQTLWWECFLVFGNFFFKTPFPGWIFVPASFAFLSFIFFPTSFRRQWAAFLGAWCPLSAFRSCFVEFAQRSNALLMNLWGRKLSPCPIPLPS